MRAHQPSLDHLRVGILGGSFDPAHQGHEHISRVARRALGLDRVIWLVARQNPFKPNQPPFHERFKTAQQQALASCPRWIIVSDFEQQQNLTRSFDVLCEMKRRHPWTKFVFLIGADIFAQLLLWHRGGDIPNLMPVAVLPRPGHSHAARHSRLAAQNAAHIVSAAKMRDFAETQPPAIAFVSAPMRDISSSALR